jgi:hypothetical protein
MAQPELSALRNLIQQAHELLEPLDLPEGRGSRARELLGAAMALADDLTKTKLPAAAQLGARGGNATAKRGSQYYRDLAAKRVKKAGGRPKNKPSE